MCPQISPILVYAPHAHEWPVQLYSSAISLKLEGSEYLCLKNFSGSMHNASKLSELDSCLLHAYASPHSYAVLSLFNNKNL